MNLYPEYKDYNKVTVEFLGYKVSNINTKGPTPDREIDNVQLQSVSIKGTSLDNPEQIGATGTITIIDYKHKVFNILAQHLTEVSNDPAGKDLFPNINIEICCYTGKIIFAGHLLQWSMSYSGGLATISIEWSVVAPDVTAGVPVTGEFNTPEALIEAGMNASAGENLKFVYVEDGKEYEGSAVRGHIVFGSSFYYDPTKLLTSGNSLVDVYRAVATNSVTSTGDALHYAIEGDKFYVYSSKPQDATKPTDDSKTCDGLVFVQNGKWPAYTKRSDGKVVIPISDFSIDINSTNIVMMGQIRDGFNGIQMTYNNQVVTLAGADSTQVSAAAAGDGNNPQNDPVTLKIGCYNVMSFSVNDKDQPITIETYDECGIIIPALSITAMVRSVDYEVNGAVVKSSFECTNLFNLDDTTAVCTDITSQGPAGGEFTSADMNYSSMDSNMSSSSSSQSSTSSTPTNMGYKQYLCSEDSRVTSLSNDKTEQLVSSGEFDKHVDEFLSGYGNLTGANRVLSYSFVSNLISSGNYGLLTLLVSVANYGISNCPSNWTLDAVNLDPDYKKKRPFCASNTGKAPFDYTKGGLGIAHWDSGNLDDIYSTIGFDPVEDVGTSAQRDHFKSLLVTDNSITGWKDITFAGKQRKAPIFSKSHPSMRLFDKGLKQDSAWLSWARKVVYFRDSNGSYTYNHYLFRLWVQKFWVPTINNLRKKQSSSSHKIGLQDATRIARAGNSATGLINSSCGKNVAKQYELYYNDKARYMRQKAFCRRCADIIGYCNP